MMGTATNTVQQKLEKIKPSLTEAIALRSYLATWNEKHEEISRKIDETHYATGFNAIGNAVVNGLLMALCRMWDRSQDANSFLSIIPLIDTDEFRSELRGDEHETARVAAINDFRDAVRGFSDSDQCHALFVSRAEGFAHNVDLARARDRMQVPRAARYDDLFQSVNLSCEIFNKADLVISSNTTFFELLSEDFDNIYNKIIDDISIYKKA